MDKKLVVRPRRIAESNSPFVARSRFRDVSFTSGGIRVRSYNVEEVVLLLALVLGILSRE